MLLLFSILLNHFVTLLEFFHWIRLMVSLIVLIWCWRIDFDNCSIEDLDGFKFLRFTTYGKLFLWFLITIKASMATYFGIFLFFYTFCCHACKLSRLSICERNKLLTHHLSDLPVNFYLSGFLLSPYFDLGQFGFVEASFHI